MIDTFRDKVAVVTGGASGLGRALCEELCRQGAISVIADINLEEAQHVALAITQAGGRACAVHVDVSQATYVEKVIDEIASKYGRLDYIFNNAGISIIGEVRDMNLENWRRIIAVNLLGVIFGTMAAYSLMVKQGYGHIVNISSLSGLTSLPICTAYATTKHAVVGFSNSLRAEASDLGVKVSVVCPGFIRTGLNDASIVLKAQRAEILNSSTYDKLGIDSTLAAQKIWCGVLCNRAIIVFPFYCYLLWWIYRLRLVFLARLESKIVKNSEQHVSSPKWNALRKFF